MKPQYEFTVKLWTVKARYRSHIEVFEDRAVIHRSGHTGGLPKESTVYFKEVSVVCWGNTARHGWIWFVVPNIMTAVEPKLYAIGALDVPYQDPNAIIFSKKYKNETKVHYDMIHKLFNEVRNK